MSKIHSSISQSYQGFRLFKLVFLNLWMFLALFIVACAISRWWRSSFCLEILPLSVFLPFMQSQSPICNKLFLFLSSCFLSFSPPFLLLLLLTNPPIHHVVHHDICNWSRHRVYRVVVLSNMQFSKDWIRPEVVLTRPLLLPNVTRIHIVPHRARYKFYLRRSSLRHVTMQYPKLMTKSYRAIACRR